MAEGVDLVNVAKTVWEVIKDGAPSAQANSAYCQAMPSKTQIPWEDLKGWQTKSFTISFKMNSKLDDLLGLDPTIDLVLKGEFRYNGHSDKTPGFFLDDFRISCQKVHVDWGWTVNINASVHGNPFNK